MSYTDSEARARAVILADEDDPAGWLAYLTGLKNLLGNFTNDLGFVATLLVKRYLTERSGVGDFERRRKEPLGSMSKR